MYTGGYVFKKRNPLPRAGAQARGPDRHAPRPFGKRLRQSPPGQVHHRSPDSDQQICKWKRDCARGDSASGEAATRGMLTHETAPATKVSEGAAARPDRHVPHRKPAFSLCIVMPETGWLGHVVCSRSVARSPPIRFPIQLHPGIQPVNEPSACTRPGRIRAGASRGYGRRRHPACPGPGTRQQSANFAEGAAVLGAGRRSDRDSPTGASLFQTRLT